MREGEGAGEAPEGSGRALQGGEGTLVGVYAAPTAADSSRPTARPAAAGTPGAGPSPSWRSSLPSPPTAGRVRPHGPVPARRPGQPPGRPPFVPFADGGAMAMAVAIVLVALLLELVALLLVLG